MNDPSYNDSFNVIFSKTLMKEGFKETDTLKCFSYSHSTFFKFPHNPQTYGTNWHLEKKLIELVAIGDEQLQKTRIRRFNEDVEEAVNCEDRILSKKT
jgi:hypothetical protein